MLGLSDKTGPAYSRGWRVEFADVALRWGPRDFVGRHLVRLAHHVFELDGRAGDVTRGVGNLFE